MTAIVKLTYFKSTGKYYSEGWFRSFQELDDDIYNEVLSLNKTKCLHHIQSGEWDGYILVEPSGGVPRLLDVNKRSIL